MCKNISKDFLEKINRANEDFSLFNRGDKILVGLSGGADSCCLLLSLCGFREKYDFEISALHVNHLIRAGEADRDEMFSKKLCEKLDVEFFCERIDVPSIAKIKGESLELCARNERYSAFMKVCKQKDIHLVATAHNANDNAETTVFNLVRGSGTHGLCGIPAKRNLGDGVSVIRPLIYVSRQEIEQYLANEKQDFVTDSTNFDNDYTRNYLRHEILPRLRRLNPSLEESIARTNRLHSVDEQYLSRLAEENMTDDVNALSKLHEAVLSRVIMRMFSSVSRELLSEFHVKALCSAIYDGKNTKVSLPDSMTARIYRGKLTFVKDDRCPKGENSDFNVNLNEKSTFFENSPYALYISFDQSEENPKIIRNGKIIYKIYTTDYLYFDTIPQCLIARNRMPGDKIYSCKMNKSIKRLLNATAFDEKNRNMLPIITKNEKIILVPAVAVNDEYKREDGNKTKVTISLYIKE